MVEEWGSAEAGQLAKHRAESEEVGWVCCAVAALVDGLGSGQEHGLGLAPGLELERRRRRPYFPSLGRCSGV